VTFECYLSYFKHFHGIWNTEYADYVSNPYKQRCIKYPKKVQTTATKLVTCIKHLRCKDRIKRLKLPTLKYRRTRSDMIEVYKIRTYISIVNLHMVTYTIQPEVTV